MSVEEKSHYGFKRITAANWLEADSLSDYGFFPEQWIAVVLEPKLNQQVPETIRALFETSRALFAYSWFFDPMGMAGAEQLKRVMEAAAREKCLQLSLPVQSPTKGGKLRATNFSTNIAQLVKANAIDQNDADRWDAVRALRNTASHPKFQQLLPPGTALGALYTDAELLNRLFP
jgi:hypothetical protein